MTQFDAPRRSPVPDRPAPVLLQFLSLYLLVLAFFIVLVSISTFENVKSNAVMNSLNSAFAAILPPSTEITQFTSRSGRFLGSEEFQETVNGLFSTALGVEKVEIVQPGSVMRVTMAAESLFYAGATEVRASHLPMVDRLIASLSGRPPGLHFDMEFVIGTPAEDARVLPVDQTLQMARAGAFVRELLARGVPPDTISIGVRRGDPDQIVMWFYVRSASEVEVFYQELLGTDAKRGGADGG